LRLHFLPSHFVKIRHCGLLANRGRHWRLERARALLGAAPPGIEVAAPVATKERTLPRCPHCGWAALFLVRVVPPLRFQAAPPITDTS
jgi:hypothetical protein